MTINTTDSPNPNCGGGGGGAGRLEPCGGYVGVFLDIRYTFYCFAEEVPSYTDVSNPDKQAVADRDFGSYPQPSYHKGKTL